MPCRESDWLRIAIAGGGEEEDAACSTLFDLLGNLVALTSFSEWDDHDFSAQRNEPRECFYYRSWLRDAVGARYLGHEEPRRWSNTSNRLVPLTNQRCNRVCPMLRDFRASWLSAAEVPCHQVGTSKVLELFIESSIE